MSAAIAATNSATPLLRIASRPAIDHPKTTSIARKCFEMLKTILTFPLRYLGSKTWSIPGLLLRAPIALCKWLFNKTTSLKQELFGSGYHFRFEKTLTPEELKPYLPYACAKAFVYSGNLDYIPPGWKLISPSSLNLPLGPIEARERCFFDPYSGFKVSLLEKDNELILAFGPLGVGGDPPEKSEHLKGKNVARLLLGANPPVFKQADHFVKALLNHPYTQNKKLTLSGQCFGGALASFAALKNQLPAVCFNSFPLGVGLQYELGSERLQAADKYVTHIGSKKDFIADNATCLPFNFLLSGIGIRTPGSFGRSFAVPTAYTKSADTHNHILGSIMQHLGYDKRTKPNQLQI